MTQMPPPVNEPLWHYLIGQQKLGPVPAETIVGMLCSGAVHPSTLVWRSGMAEWLPAGQVPEFANIVPPQMNVTISPSLGETNILGLNTAGFIIFIVLLLCCIPLCWLPWVIDGLKARPQ